MRALTVTISPPPLLFVSSLWAEHCPARSSETRAVQTLALSCCLLAYLEGYMSSRYIRMTRGKNMGGKGETQQNKTKGLHTYKKPKVPFRGKMRVSSLPCPPHRASPGLFESGRDSAANAGKRFFELLLGCLFFAGADADAGPVGLLLHVLAGYFLLLPTGQFLQVPFCSSPKTPSPDIMLAALIISLFLFPCLFPKYLLGKVVERELKPR